MGECQDQPVFVLDFSRVVSIQSKAWGVLASQAKEFAKGDKKIILLSNSELSKAVKYKGLEHLFECVERVVAPGLRVDNSEIKRTILEVADALLGGVLHNLETSLGLTATVGKPYFKTPCNQHDFDWVAKAHVRCVPFRGLILLEFPNPTLAAFTQSQSGDLHRDWMAECLNIALGRAKPPLNERGYKLENEIPDICQKSTLVLGSETQVITIPLTCPKGPFYLEIVMDLASPKN